MRLFLSHSLFALSLLSLPVAGVQEAQVRLFCPSLVFQKATTKLFGQIYTLELSTLEGEPGNGELRPLFDPAQPSHGSRFRLNDPTLGDITGELRFDTPPFADANGNGFDDFFEASQGVSTTITQGIFIDDTGGDGTVTATWKRSADSTTGTCKLVLEHDVFGVLPDFTPTFELLEFTGPFNYTPGNTNVTGAINLVQTGNAASTLAGPMSFTKAGTNRFDEIELQAGTWTNASASTLTFTNSLIQRDLALKTNYFGSLLFVDGNPNPKSPGYPFWVISIDDANDTDKDGIPDLSDDAGATPTSPPKLALTRAESTLLLSIRGEFGKAVEVQETPTLAPLNWTTVLSVTLTNDPHAVELLLPATGTRFWRVIVP